MRKLNDYSGYDVHSFAADEHFQDWVLRGKDPEYWKRAMDAYPHKNEAMERAKNILTSLKFEEKWPSRETVERSLQKALEKTSGREPKTKMIFMRKWWAVAASILLLVGVGLGIYTLTKPEATPPVSVRTNDVIPAPQRSRAAITLADGSIVFLDSLQNGTVATQGNITVVKLANGQLVYNPTSPITDHRSQLAYNTLTNPRGSRVMDIILADGTHVWLNAGSSITYPVAFIENERRVTLTGEGYFEVAHNAAKPFHVQVGEMDVAVLGTHFNVNAYGDEPQMTTTLLEGSVKVSVGAGSRVIAPGQQAAVQRNGSAGIKVTPADVYAAVAWKNGYFHFNNADIREVMRQISRWYDIQVLYAGNFENRKFGGEIARDATLNELIKILEESRIHIRMEGRKIWVTQ